MKSLVKNIVIAAEFVIIAVLLAAVIRLYPEKRNAVETAASVPDSDNPVDYEDIKERVSKNYYDLSGKKVLMDDSTFGEIWIPALENVPAFSREKSNLKSRNGRMFYVEDSQIKSYLGVDVSVHQDDIDWNEVKRAGIDFAMIRLGFRGYGTGEAQLDDNYRQNIDGARAAGLDAGVYFFSQAVTVDEALEEAQIVIDSLDGLDVNYPVVYDWEIIYDLSLIHI